MHMLLYLDLIVLHCTILWLCHMIYSFIYTLLDTSNVYFIFWERERERRQNEIEILPYVDSLLTCPQRSELEQDQARSQEFSPVFPHGWQESNNVSFSVYVSKKLESGSGAWTKTWELWSHLRHYSRCSPLICYFIHVTISLPEEKLPSCRESLSSTLLVITNVTRCMKIPILSIFF